MAALFALMIAPTAKNGSAAIRVIGRFANPLDDVVRPVRLQHPAASPRMSIMSLGGALTALRP
jgi:hypothetical protein